MKSWNDLPYWGRGAIIGVILCVAFIFFQTAIVPQYFYHVCDTSYCVSSFAQSIESFYNITLIPLLWSLAAPVFLSSQIALNISAMIYYIIVGAFFGLIYGKIRHGKGVV